MENNCVTNIFNLIDPHNGIEIHLIIQICVGQSYRWFVISWIKGTNTEQDIIFRKIIQDQPNVCIGYNQQMFF